MDIVDGVGMAAGLLLGVMIHEFVQHRVAYALGDKTPRLMGRLRFSLTAHADPLGTYIVPAVLVLAALFSDPFIAGFAFAWGKPHAINPAGLRDPKRDLTIVNLTGPASLLILAVVAGRTATAVGVNDAAGRGLEIVALAALFMAVVEILPIPGRDGGDILARFLSPSAASKMNDLKQYAVLFLLVLFILPFLSSIPSGMVRSLCGLVAGDLPRC